MLEGPPEFRVVKAVAVFLGGIVLAVVLTNAATKVN